MRSTKHLGCNTARRHHIKVFNPSCGPDLRRGRPRILDNHLETMVREELCELLDSGTYVDYELVSQTAREVARVAGILVGDLGTSWARKALARGLAQSAGGQGRIHSTLGPR